MNDWSGLVKFLKFLFLLSDFSGLEIHVSAINEWLIGAEKFEDHVHIFIFFLLSKVSGQKNPEIHVLNISEWLIGPEKFEDHDQVSRCFGKFKI